MPLESFMRRQMRASLSPASSSPSTSSASASAEKRSSAHFSTAVRSSEALETAHQSQSADEAAAFSSDEYRDEPDAEADEDSQVSQDYEVVGYQREHQHVQDEEGSTDDCNSHEEQPYADVEEGTENCSATLQHLSGRISDAKARHCQQVAEVSAEIDKMRTALKRYIDGLMDQLHRDFVADPDATQVASLNQLQEQCSKLQNSKRKIAQMGAMWEKKAKLIRQT